MCMHGGSLLYLRLDKTNHWWTSMLERIRPLHLSVALAKLARGVLIV